MHCPIWDDSTRQILKWLWNLTSTQPAAEGQTIYLDKESSTSTKLFFPSSFSEKKKKKKGFQGFQSFKRNMRGILWQSYIWEKKKKSKLRVIFIYMARDHCNHLRSNLAFHLCHKGDKNSFLITWSESHSKRYLELSSNFICTFKDLSLLPTDNKCHVSFTLMPEKKKHLCSRLNILSSLKNDRHPQQEITVSMTETLIYLTLKRTSFNTWTTPSCKYEGQP